MSIEGFIESAGPAWFKFRDGKNDPRTMPIRRCFSNDAWLSKLRSHLDAEW